MAYLNVTSAPTTGFAASAASIFENLATRYKRRKLYRETFNGLSALTNRDLADLGLSRGELHAVAWDAAQNAKV